MTISPLLFNELAETLYYTRVFVFVKNCYAAHAVSRKQVANVFKYLLMFVLMHCTVDAVCIILYCRPSQE